MPFLQTLFYMQYALARICFFNFPSVLSSYFNQYVSLSLVNPDIRSFYIPKVKTVNNMRKDYFTCDALDAGLIEPWKVLPIHIS